MKQSISGSTPQREKNLLKRCAIALGGLAGTFEGVREALEDKGKGELRHEDVHFEHSDLNARGTFLTGAGVVIGMWIITGLLFFYFAFLKNNRAEVSPPPLPAEAHGNPVPPEPRLQSSPPQDLKAFEARQDWELNHYYWIDKNKGNVAIPIEQAIRIIAKRGLPPENLAPNKTLTPPQAGTRATGLEGKVEPEPR